MIPFLFCFLVFLYPTSTLQSVERGSPQQVRLEACEAQVDQMQGAAISGLREADDPTAGRRCSATQQMADLCKQGSALHVEGYPERAITYSFSGGRFGDNLLAYLHAKWISYSYNIPLFYQPFPYSNQLILDDKERKSTQEIRSQMEKTRVIRSLEMLDNEEPSSTLYILPYFPESQNDRTINPRHFYIPVDWKEEGFHALINELVQPKIPIPRLDLPTDCITVAVHVRRGGGWDSPNAQKIDPLRFPSDQFYIQQIRDLYDHFQHSSLYRNGLKNREFDKEIPQNFDLERATIAHEQGASEDHHFEGKLTSSKTDSSVCFGIYVYLFTDDPSPAIIAKNFQQSLKDLNICLDYRREGNSHHRNVLEDFFSMMQFDCLIHPESNYSILVSKIGDFKLIVHPLHYHWEGKIPVIDQVEKIWRM